MTPLQPPTPESAALRACADLIDEGYIADPADVDRGARRGQINARVWAQADHEAEQAITDEARLARAMEALGDASAAWLRGHSDITDCWLVLAGVCAAALDDSVRRAGL